MRHLGRLVAVSILATVTSAFGGELNPNPAPRAELRPAPGLTVTVSAGTWVTPDNTPHAVEAGTLKFDPPESRHVSVTEPVPRDFSDAYKPWDPWPNHQFDPGRTKVPNYISLSPQRDEDNVQILGMLFRSVVPESIVVTTEDGKKTFEAGKDYIVNEKWALIAGLDGRLGKPVESKLKVGADMNLQRLDLIQADAKGQVSVKKGKSSWVCPELPAPDKGLIAMAGVYIAPWKRDKVYAIAPEDIRAIVENRPVAPINPDRLARARAKLESGGELKIAFLGDSITLGAEAPKWWDSLWTENNLGYPSRVVVGLRKAYPKATVTPIAAFRGGITTGKAAELFEKSVVPQKADVLVVAFGANDANGAIGRPPMNTPEQHKKDLQAIVAKAKAAGTEVIIVTSMQPSPYMDNKIGERIKDYRKVQIELAKEESVGCADVYTAWMNLSQRGIPPFSQLHNCTNHPGIRGHAVYAETVMPFFKQ